MARNFSTNSQGRTFSQDEVEAVWEKGTVVPGNDSNNLRKDDCGAWIQKSQYGKTEQNGYGWEIDHIVPIAKGGTDVLSNLQPLQWQNNRHKGDNYPNWDCLIKAK